MLPNICDIQPNKISSNMKSKIFWFHGEPGTWKTTVASKFPKAFIAGFEIGYQFIEGVRALPMGGWSDMKDLYRQLKMPQVKETYDTIVFDTISNEFEVIIDEDIISLYKGDIYWSLCEDHIVGK